MSSSLLKIVSGLALAFAVFGFQQDTHAADGCCGNAAPVRLMPRLLPAPPVLFSPTVPCCGGLPVLMPIPMTVTSGGLISDGYGFVVPGMHARYPYYDYRTRMLLPDHHISTET